MHHLMIVAAGLALLAGLVTFGAAQPPNPINPEAAAVAKGNNAFAVDLYGRLKQQDGNLFFSPYSLSSALAMTYAGARGTTAEAMAQTLHFPFAHDRLHPAFANLLSELDRKGTESKYQLSIANRLWGQKDYGFLPDFVKLSAVAYRAGLQELDFQNATEQSRETINSWVEKETQGRIKDILPAGSLPPDTRLVLTNAIYFKGNWLEAFPGRLTAREDFKLPGGKKVQVNMMHLQEMRRLAENDDLQMLELPYQDRELAMLVVLPRKVDGLAGVEKQLTAENLDKWLGEMKNHQVNIGLPKFKFTSEFKLKPVLSDLGMGIAFGKEADFSGMASREKLFIDDVFHKAFVTVDEKGTEAAAATGVTARPMAAPGGMPVVFQADHPFLFLIRDQRTCSILFMGRVVQP